MEHEDWRDLPQRPLLGPDPEQAEAFEKAIEKWRDPDRCVWRETVISPDEIMSLHIDLNALKPEEFWLKHLSV